MTADGYADKVAALWPLLRSAPGLGEYVETGIFGAVVISEVYATEAEARRAGYCYDAAAYRVNAFGAREPVPYKVLARWTDFTHKIYCVVEGI